MVLLFFPYFGYYEAAGRDTGITSIVHNTGITSILPESSSICNTGTDTGKSRIMLLYSELHRVNH
jgi:hypothetical protein